MWGHRVRLSFTQLVVTNAAPGWHPVSALVKADVRAAAYDPQRCRELACQLELARNSPSREVFASVISALERGQLHAEPLEHRASVSGPPSPEVALRDLGENAGDIRATYQIVIELVGEDDEPVPGLAYRLLGPDGRTRSGRLDTHGRAEILDLDVDGECRVCFPELDQDAWEPLSTHPL